VVRDDIALLSPSIATLCCGSPSSLVIGHPLSLMPSHPSSLHSISMNSNRRATHTHAPDFAYALTTRKFLAMLAPPDPPLPHLTPPTFTERSNSQRKTFENDLDLSSLQHMINAGPPPPSPSHDPSLCQVSLYDADRSRCLRPSSGSLA
jgi:hypothetical protein